MANPDEQVFKTAYFVAFRNYARSVACNPKESDQFVIGEGSGCISIHSIRNREALAGILLPLQGTLSQQGGMLKNVITACSYSSDGRKVICTTHSQKLCIADVEACKVIQTYENCAYKTQLKSGLAVDRSKDYLVASTDFAGKGVTFYDYRQSAPIDVIKTVHLTWVPDMEFVPDGWPWSRYCNCLLTVCTDGQMKVISIDGKLLDVVDVGHITHGCALTPEPFDFPGTAFASFATIAGECLSTVLPSSGLERKLALPQLANALRIKYSSSGSKAFVACDDGLLRFYQRSSSSLHEQGSLVVHQQAISDLAISSSDEHAVTTSEDGNVYVTNVGPPNHGATEWFEIA